jgi:hypothetical protein
MVLTVLASVAAQADTVYRCAGPAGEVYFTDRVFGRPFQTLTWADVLTLPAPMRKTWRCTAAPRQAARERSADKDRRVRAPSGETGAGTQLASQKGIERA